MEAIIAYAYLWAHGLCTVQDYTKALDAKYSNPLAQKLKACPIQHNDVCTEIAEYLSSDCKKLDDGKLTKAFGEQIEKVYREGSLSIKDFAERCYCLWQEHLNSSPFNELSDIANSDAFLVLSYIKDPLEYGDEAQAKDLAEAFLAMYKGQAETKSFDRQPKDTPNNTTSDAKPLLKNIPGKKLRKIFFGDFAIIFIILLALVLLRTLINGSYNTDARTIYLPFVPFIILFSVLAVISKLFGEVECVLDDKGLHYNKRKFNSDQEEYYVHDFISWDRISDITYSFGHPRIGPYHRKPSYADVTYLNEKGKKTTVSIKDAPFDLILRSKKYIAKNKQ